MRVAGKKLPFHTQQRDKKKWLVEAQKQVRKRKREAAMEKLAAQMLGVPEAPAEDAEYGQHTNSALGRPSTHHERLIYHVENDDRSLVWVHIPKTGSTFCLTMAHYRCPLLFNATCHVTPLSAVTLKQGCAQLPGMPSSCEAATLKDHGPLVPELLSSARRPERRLVIIMRRPAARAVSMFADSRHVVGLQGSMKRALDEAMLNRSEVACRHIRRSKQPQHKACDEAAAFSVFLRHPAASGCVAKTLVGKWCNDPFSITDEEHDLALLRLHTQFAFVGIFERWNETVSAFHTQLMGSPHRRSKSSFSSSSADGLVKSRSKPCAVELGNTRQRPADAAVVSAALEVETAVFQDRWDGPLYEEALGIFGSYK